MGLPFWCMGEMERSSRKRLLNRILEENQEEESKQVEAIEAVKSKLRNSRF